MKLIEALTQCPAIPFFGRIEGLESDTDDVNDMELEPIDAPVLRESEISHFFIVKAKNVLPDGTIRDCYIDICLPERISDYAYFVNDGQIDVRYHHQFEGEIICAVPIDCFGVYDLFYSKQRPEVGIEVLRRGLAASAHKVHIAEDLGYIFRDEARFAEAAEMFQIAVENGPSSYFIYGELAECYERLGDDSNAQKYHSLFRSAAYPGITNG